MFSPLAVASSSIDENSIRLVINNVNRLKSLHSPPIIVGNLPWQIQVEHRDHSGKIGGGENALAIHLHSLNADRTNWSCAAMATIKLATLGITNRQPPLIKVIGPWTFNRYELNWSRNLFIRWVDLFDRNAGYVRNNRLQLDITIAAQTTSAPQFLLLQHILNVFQINFRVENARDLLAADSGEFGFSGFKWKIVVRKNRFENDEHSYLGIILYCIPIDNNTPYFWSRNIFAEFCLRSERTGNGISSGGGGISGGALSYDCVQQFNETKKFTNTNRCHGITKFIKWGDLMHPQNGYVQNNHLTITVNMRDDSRNDNGNNNSRNNRDHPVAIFGHRNNPIIYQIPLLLDHIDGDGVSTADNGSHIHGINDENINTINNLSTTTTDAVTTNNDSPISFTCPICLGSLIGREILSTACGHVYCKNCILTSMKARMRCPNCRSHLDADKIHPLHLS